MKSIIIESAPMKKLIIIALLAIATITAWKYIKKPVQKSAPVQAVDETLETTSNYVPAAIENKKQMENNINSAVNRTNDKINEEMDQIK